jgi:hypothetical protein
MAFKGIIVALELRLVTCCVRSSGGNFGNGRLITFSYLQNFDCVDQPTMDLDFNGVKAQSDPNEMQTPICQAVTEPTADPAGEDHQAYRTSLSFQCSQLTMTTVVSRWAKR